MKKRHRILPLIAITLLLLAGCQQNDLAKNINRAIEDWEPPARSVKESQIDVYTKPDFSDVLEFTVSSYPNDKALTPYKFFAIDRWFAQVEYKTEKENTYVLRLARAGNGVLSSTYSESHSLNRNTQEIDGISVTIANASKGCTLVSWEKEGYQYILHAKQGVDLSEQEIERFVKELKTEENSVTSKG